MERELLKKKEKNHSVEEQIEAFYIVLFVFSLFDLSD